MFPPTKRSWPEPWMCRNSADLFVMAMPPGFDFAPLKRHEPLYLDWPPLGVQVDWSVIRGMEVALVHRSPALDRNDFEEMAGRLLQAGALEVSTLLLHANRPPTAAFVWNCYPPGLSRNGSHTYGSCKALYRCVGISHDRPN
jgi:hypothetical protein